MTGIASILNAYGVIPEIAGIHLGIFLVFSFRLFLSLREKWIPAFAGITNAEAQYDREGHSAPDLISLTR